MLNLQKTTIICVLFVTVWGNPPGDLSAENLQLIGYFEDSLMHVKGNKNLIPQGCHDHLQSWESWKKIPDGDKLGMAQAYKEMAVKSNLRLETGPKNALAELAYQALDERANWWIKSLKNGPKKKRGKAMEKVVKNGLFMDALAFEGGPEKYLEWRENLVSSSKFCGLYFGN